VATVAGVDLRLEEGRFKAGSAFRIVTADFAPRSIEPGDGYLVEIRPRDGVAVVFDERPATPGDFRPHDAAQRALDILAYADGQTTGLIRAHDECVAWWINDDGVTVRPVVTRDVGIRVGGSLGVTGPDGKPRPIPPRPVPTWTEALRYLRFSQLAEDVFDAYRNAFLALEAILSARVTGGPTGDWAWLKYALQTLITQTGLDLSRYLSSPAADPVAAFRAEQYAASRCATFHAKAHRGALLPGSVDDRELVLTALNHVTRLVIDLAEPVVGTRRPSGGVTPYGFGAIFIGPKIDSLRMSLRSVDEASIPIETHYIGNDPDDDRVHAFGGRADVRELAGRAWDGLDVTAAGGEGLAAGPFDESFPILPIEVEGVTAVEPIVAFVLNNLREPRRRFSR
jgi:hypothetical protein